MNNVIIGTAGHVDHGKTCLIKALTGIDTDRLKEEKKRGITIELGFADMIAPDGTDIGIIDVPGHEKFIKNMLMGIGGIDLVLLVVAADEGVMPQTVEHLDIMRLLSIKKGIIVITKSDCVEPEWLEMVEDDIRSAVRGSFLENAPSIAVSSFTGQGIEELRNMIFEMVKTPSERNTNPAILRIPIDRVFTISGFGTVITGTLTEGTIKLGQEVTIYPQGLNAKVRSLQVHGNMVEAAYAGQRTAVNLQNVKKEDVSRGNVLAASGSLKVSMMADVRLNMLADSGRTIENGARLHCYYGSEEILCKAILLDTDILRPGESCYAQLRFEGQVVLKQGDYFVVRYYSPVETIGGGIVLNADPAKHKTYDLKLIEALRVRELGDDSDVIGQALLDSGKEFKTVSSLAKELGMTEDDAREHMNEMAGRGKAVRLSNDIYSHIDYANKVGETAEHILHEFHSKNPFFAGMQKEEFRSKLSGAEKIKDAKSMEALIGFLADIGKIRISTNFVCAGDFEVTYTKTQLRVMDEIKQIYRSCGCEAPEIDTVTEKYKNRQEARQLILALEVTGDLTRLCGNSYLYSEILGNIKDKIRDVITKKGSISLAELRDMLGTSRKYAMMILDYCDLIKLTRMEGDVRVLY